MNKTYRLIWSDARQTWIVAHERANSRGKPSSSSKSLTLTLTSALLLHSPYLQAIDPSTLPTGGQVVAGQANISQSGTAMTIQQGSDKAILNWSSFSIGSGASVTFQQPTSSSITLNRVIGSDPSAIYGSLTANGQVFLINPNGVLFGQGARVDVAGLVASTLNLRNEDFLAGNLRFTRDGATASVVNEGDIYGHYVALLAPEVRNEGLIAARQGTVVLAAGDAVTLNITGNRLVDVQVDPASISTLVENRHLIQAEEGLVILSAKSAHNLLGKVINSGEIDATGISSDGGTVRLLASSEIEYSGKIDVSAAQVGSGGKAILIADLDNPNSKTTVSGTIWARGGSTSGDGGFVETSASHLKIASGTRVGTSAVNGKRGLWLLDPTDFVVGAGGDMDGATLSNNLDDGIGGGGDIIIQSASGGGGTNGDIIINDAVTWANMSRLTLEADRDIRINAALDFSVMGSLNLDYGRGVAGTGKATIASGVAWAPFNGTIIDQTNSNAGTAASYVNTTTYDYLIGTKGLNTYVRAIAGTTDYGDSINYGFFDAAAAGTRYNVFTPGGTAVWSTNGGGTTFTAFNANTYNTLTYQSGLTVSDNRYTFATGNAANGVIVAPRAITLTANNRTKTEGTALTLGAGSTAFSLSLGTMAYSEQIDSVTLGEATGKASSLATPVGLYTSEMTIASAAGSNGFNSSNYAITYTAGNLTVSAAGAPTPTPTPAPTLSSCASPMFTINGVCSNPPTTTPAPCMDGQINVGGQCVTPQRPPVRDFVPDSSCDVATHYSPSPGLCAPRTQCADGLQAMGGDATHDNTCAPPPPPSNCPPGWSRPYGYQDCQPNAEPEITCKANEVLTEGRCQPKPTPLPTCPPGQERPQSGGECVAVQEKVEEQPCGAGTYKSEKGSCIACPPGSFSSTAGTAACSPCASGTTSMAGASACFADAKADDWKKVLNEIKVPAASPEPTNQPDAALANMTNAQYVQYILNNGTSYSGIPAQKLKAFSDACDKQIAQGVPKEKIDAYKEERLKTFLAKDGTGICSSSGSTCLNQSMVTELRKLMGLEPLKDEDLAKYPPANYDLPKRFGPCGLTEVDRSCVSKAPPSPSPSPSDSRTITNWLTTSKDRDAFVATWQRSAIEPQLNAKVHSYSESTPPTWESLDDFVNDMKAKQKSGIPVEEVQAYKETKLSAFLKQASQGACDAEPRTISCSRELVVAAREKFGLPKLKEEDLENYPSVGDYYDKHVNDWKKSLEKKTFPESSPAPSSYPDAALKGASNAGFANLLLTGGNPSAVDALQSFARACDDLIDQGVSEATITAYKEERLQAYLSTGAPCASSGSVCPNQEVVSILRGAIGLERLADSDLAKYPLADYDLANRFDPDVNKPKTTIPILDDTDTQTPLGTTQELNGTSIQTTIRADHSSGASPQQLTPNQLNIQQKPMRDSTQQNGSNGADSESVTVRMDRMLPVDTTPYQSSEPPPEIPDGLQKLKPDANNIDVRIFNERIIDRPLGQD